MVKVRRSVVIYCVKSMVKFSTSSLKFYRQMQLKIFKCQNSCFGLVNGQTGNPGFYVQLEKSFIVYTFNIKKNIQSCFVRTTKVYDRAVTVFTGRGA